MLIPKPFFLIMCHKSDYKKLEDEKADKELRDDIVMMSDHAATDIDTDIVAVKTAPVKN